MGKEYSATDNGGETLVARDAALDVVRFTALCLMVSIHWGRVVPRDAGSAIWLLQWIGETAPCLFFFAFGITLHRYLRKPLGERVEQTLQLLALGILHSLMLQGSPFTSEFFTFFAVSKLVMDLTCSGGRRAQWVAGAVVCLVSIAWIWKPVAAYVVLGAANPGPFPVFPWVAFVLAGYLFQVLRAQRHLAFYFTLAAGLAGLALAMHGAPLHKWPLTPAYFLICAGAVAGMFCVLDAIGLRRTPGIVRATSENLLMASVVHYAVVWPLAKLHVMTPQAAAPDTQWIAYIGLSVIGMVALIALVSALARIQGRLLQARLAPALGESFPFVALTMIVAYSFVSGAGKSALGMGPVEVKITGVALMAFLTLLMPLARVIDRRAAIASAGVHAEARQAS